VFPELEDYMSQKPQPTTGSKFCACSILHITTNIVLPIFIFMSCSYLFLDLPHGQCWRYLCIETLESHSHTPHPIQAASCLEVLIIIGWNCRILNFYSVLCPVRMSGRGPTNLFPDFFFVILLRSYKIMRG